MNSIYYKVLVTVAALGSVSSAANTLNYSQPNISHIINSFEKEAGFPIFNRGKDSLSPTVNGQIVIEHCKKIVSDIESLNQTILDINGLSRGEVKIGALSSMMTTFVPMCISDFRKKYPQITVKLYDKKHDDLQLSLNNSDIDISFSDELKDPYIEFLPLFTLDMCVAMPQNHPLSEYQTIRFEQLKGFNLIMPPPNDRMIFTQTSPDLNEHLSNILYYTSDDNAAVQMVEKDFGLYFLSKLQESILPAGVVLRDIEPGNFRRIGLCTKKNHKKSPALQEFIKTAKQIAESFIDENKGVNSLCDK